MKIITRPYAIIYIDVNGDTLSEKKEGYATVEMVNAYYKNLNFLQWNYYLIIPQELTTPELEKELVENDQYTRKFVVRTEQIDTFIEDNFPEGKIEPGRVIILVRENYEKAKAEADALANAHWKAVQGYYRNVNLDQALLRMDALRAALIRHPNTKVIYYTHMDHEADLAEKKFYLFL